MLAPSPGGLAPDPTLNPGSAPELYLKAYAGSVFTTFN